MKLKFGEDVFDWYFESILTNRFAKTGTFSSLKEIHDFHNRGFTIISKKVYQSELFQTLLKDKIEGLR